MPSRLVMSLMSLALLALAAPAGAQDFPLDRWLDEPDVKLVAVEFYADWCEPCLEAAPKWEKLRKRYAAQGLKLVVINTRAKRPGCPKLPWKPDESLCDPRGQLADSLQVGELPSAFLWSWQGNLLVDRGHHVDEVEQAVKKYLDTNPRIQVVAKSASGRPDKRLKRLFEAEFSREGKLTVVADREMRKRLKRVRKESWDPSRKDRQRCKLGAEVSANSILSVEIQGAEASLMLVNAETGCQRGVFSPWDPEQVGKSVTRATRRILADLVQRPAKMPGAGIRRRAKAVERDLTTATEKWSAASGQDVAIVRFESEPTGALVMMDQKVLCQQTPCSRAITTGQHRFTMTRERYLSRTETARVDEGMELLWTLEADFAVLHIGSTPSGQPVSIDKREVGKTPLRDHHITTGVHQVVVGDACHYTAGEQLVLERGDERPLDYKLEVRPAGLQITARDDEDNDIEAQVRVDGQLLGRTPGTFTVPVCSTRLEVSADGYKTWRQDLSLREKATVTVEAGLQPKRGQRAARKRNRRTESSAEPTANQDIDRRNKKLLAHYQKEYVVWDEMDDLYTGYGVVGIGVGGALALGGAIMYLGDGEGYTEDVDGKEVPIHPEDAKSQGEATLMLGLGLAAVGGALLLVRPDPPKKPTLLKARVNHPAGDERDVAATSGGLQWSLGPVAGLGLKLSASF